jgi:hypothetical protein
MYELFSVWKDWKDVDDVQKRYEALRQGFHEGLWATLENEGKKPDEAEPDKEDAYGQGKKQGMEAGEKYWAIIFDGDKKKGTKGIHQKFMDSKFGKKWYWDKRHAGETDPQIDQDLLDLVLWGLKKNGSIDLIVKDAMRRIEEKLQHDLYLAFVKTHDDHWYKEPGWMPRDAVFQYLYRHEIKINDYDQPGVPDDVYYRAIEDAWYLHDKKGTGKKGRKQKVAPPPADGKPLPVVKKKDQAKQKDLGADVKPAKKKKAAPPPPPPPPPPPAKKQEPPPPPDPDWPKWVPPGKKQPYKDADQALQAAGWLWANGFKLHPGNGNPDEDVYFPGDANSSPAKFLLLGHNGGFIIADAQAGFTYTAKDYRMMRSFTPTLKEAMEALGVREVIRGAAYTRDFFGNLSDPTFGWLESRNGKPVIPKGDSIVAFITEENGQYETGNRSGIYWDHFDVAKGSDSVVSR